MKIPQLFAVHDKWTDQALCVGGDPEMWFSLDEEVEAEAKAICADCPVREKCLDEAYAQSNHHGVWGGLTPDERRSYARVRSRLKREKEKQDVGLRLTSPETYPPPRYLR